MNKYQEALNIVNEAKSVIGMRYGVLKADLVLETLQELADKEQPKKVLQNYRGDYFCRNCLGLIWQNANEVNYCAYCGQKIQLDNL